MTARLTTAAYVLGYASALGALVAGCALAPRATGAVVVVGVGLALVCVLGAGGYHATYDCIGAHCGMVFVREDGRR